MTYTRFTIVSRLSYNCLENMKISSKNDTVLDSVQTQEHSLHTKPALHTNMLYYIPTEEIRGQPSFTRAHTSQCYKTHKLQSKI